MVSTVDTKKRLLEWGSTADEARRAWLRALEICVNDPRQLAVHFPEYLPSSVRRDIDDVFAPAPLFSSGDDLAARRVINKREDRYRARASNLHVSDAVTGPEDVRYRTSLLLVLRDMYGPEGLPTDKSVLEMRLRERGLERPGARAGGGGTDDVHVPLVAEELGRERYRCQGRRPEVWGPRFSRGLGLLVASLAGTEEGMLLETTLEWLESTYVTFYSVTELRAVLKKVSTWAKREGDVLKGWRALVSLDVLGGYREPLDAVEFVEEVRGWVQGEGQDDPGAFLPGWMGAVDTEMGLCLPVGYEPRTTFPEYVQSGDWARSGTSGFSTEIRVLDDRGYEVGVRQTKDTIFLANSKSDLLSVVADSTRQVAKALIKRETGKSRSVIISDLPLHLEMSWVASALEPASRGVTPTTLYQNSRQTAEMWSDILTSVSVLPEWAIPLDQSEFDFHVSKGLLNSYFRHLHEKADVSLKPAIVRIWKKIVIDRTWVEVGSDRIEVLRGLLSGWRLTSHCGTVVNVAETRGSLMWLVRMGVIPKRLAEEAKLIFQGDDVDLRTTNPSLGVAVCEVLRMAGLNINPTKTWVSLHRDEFLRRVAENRVLHGYPARAVSSILWRNPIRPEDIGPVSKARGVVVRWLTLCGRGAKYEIIFRLLVDELRSIFSSWGIAVSLILRWLATPVWGGGFGLPQVGPSLHRAIVMPVGTGKSYLAKKYGDFIDIDWVIFPPEGDGTRRTYHAYLSSLTDIKKRRPDAVLLCHDYEQAEGAGYRVVGAVVREPLYYTGLTNEKFEVAKLNLAKLAAVPTVRVSQSHSETERMVLEMADLRMPPELVGYLDQAAPEQKATLRNARGLDAILGAFSGVGFGRRALTAIKQAAVNALKPFDHRALLERLGKGGELLRRPGYHQWDGRRYDWVRRGKRIWGRVLFSGTGELVIPGSARFPAVESGLVPKWAMLSAVRAQADSVEWRLVDKFLRPLDRPMSHHIRSVHGKWTWISWLTGTLTLTVKPWVGWDTGWVARRWAGRARHLVGRCLGSSRPMRRDDWVALDSAFYQSQTSPDMYSAWVVQP